MRKIIILSLLIFFLTPSVTFAAPETAVLLSESSGVHLPGVLGGILAFIALMLPFTLRAWARKNWDDEG